MKGLTTLEDSRETARSIRHGTPSWHRGARFLCRVQTSRWIFHSCGMLRGYLIHCCEFQFESYLTINLARHTRTSLKLLINFLPYSYLIFFRFGQKIPYFNSGWRSCICGERPKSSGGYDSVTNKRFGRILLSANGSVGRRNGLEETRSDSRHSKPSTGWSRPSQPWRRICLRRSSKQGTVIPHLTTFLGSEFNY